MERVGHVNKLIAYLSKIVPCHQGFLLKHFSQISGVKEVELWFQKQDETSRV